MIPELGHFCLILALVISGLQTFMPQDNIRKNCASLLLVLITAAFFSLIVCYVTSDFTVLNVANNSHTLKPLLYKITGTWGNHEGSMLLWLLILSVFGFALSRDKNISTAQRDIALRVQGALAFGFASFIIFTSDPFIRVFPPPPDGSGLNPLLQDIGLAVHPPLLYTGYVGFSAAFSLAVAALVTGTSDQISARAAKPYILAAWSALTAGIALGSWWAYYELGWGGWWFWDPVENASLMPWIAGTALLHSHIVLEKRGGLVRWTNLLAILTFSLSILGTFLVRSGVLTSVHSFAADPERGFFVLVLLCIFTGGAFLLYALRAHKLNAPDISFSAISRESGMIFNNVFMVTSCATVFIGTLYPIFMQALDLGEISVGAPYFNMTVLPLFLPAIILTGLAPFLAWKKTNTKTLIKKLLVPLPLFLISCALPFLYTYKGILPTAAVICALWLLISSLYEWLDAVQYGRRIFTLPLSRHAMSLAHTGAAVAIFGMVGTSAYIIEDIKPLNVKESFDIGGYTLRLDALTSEFGENYAADTAVISVLNRDTGQQITTLKPQRRYFPVAVKTTTESDIHTTFTGDLYVAISENPSLNDTLKNLQPRYLIRAYVHPLIPLLWCGFALITAGGVLSFTASLRKKYTETVHP